jgi:hypothetical protein
MLRGRKGEVLAAARTRSMGPIGAREQTSLPVGGTSQEGGAMKQLKLGPATQRARLSVSSAGSKSPSARRHAAVLLIAALRTSSKACR